MAFETRPSLSCLLNQVIMRANIDPSEVEKFSAVAARWWDPESEFRPLHLLNPIRLEYINQQAPLKDATVLDVGCGGGILTESMAELGATVTGIDASEGALEVAKLHLSESQLKVRYDSALAEEFSESNAEAFDVITCMEVLEHVPDPGSMVAACATMLKPGGDLFFSTLNRTPKSWLLGIVGAEYILQMLPRGTHQYERFIRPSELQKWCLNSKLAIHDIIGMHYNPLTQSFRLGPGVDVNYIAHCKNFE